MRRKRTLSVSLIVLLALGCASANKMSRRSELALMAGDLRGAYEHARHAVEKEPGNPRARAAYATAATRLLDDRKARILSIAEVDTVAAAVQTLGLEAFSKVRPLFTELLKPRQPQSVQIAALETLARFDDPAVPVLLLEAWPSLKIGRAHV